MVSAVNMSVAIRCRPVKYRNVEKGGNVTSGLYKEQNRRSTAGIPRFLKEPELPSYTHMLVMSTTTKNKTDKAFYFGPTRIYNTYGTSNI